jgi:hypothetical protein
MAVLANAISLMGICFYRECLKVGFIPTIACVFDAIDALGTAFQ